MNIKYRDGVWIISIEDDETEFRDTANNIYEIKSRFMKHMSSIFDRAIEDKCMETNIIKDVF